MLRFSNDFFFQWVENLWKKESIEKLNVAFIFLSILNDSIIVFLPNKLVKQVGEKEFRVEARIMTLGRM